MSILCKWFGHKLPKGYGGDSPYLSIKGGTIDGIGTRHAFMWTKCDRCGEEYHVANVHLHEDNREMGRFWAFRELANKLVAIHDHHYEVPFSYEDMVRDARELLEEDKADREKASLYKIERT